MSATTTAKTSTGEVVFTIKDDHGLLAELRLRDTSDTFQASDLTTKFVDVLRSKEGETLADIDDEAPAAQHHGVEVEHRRPRKTAKQKKLEHYATRELKKFVQIDVWTDEPEDYVMRHDEDGDCVFVSMTKELMIGASIRVLADPTLAKEDAIRALRKAIDLYESDLVNEIRDNTEADSNRADAEGWECNVIFE